MQLQLACRGQWRLGDGSGQDDAVSDVFLRDAALTAFFSNGRLRRFCVTPSVWRKLVGITRSRRLNTIGAGWNVAVPSAADHPHGGVAKRDAVETDKSNSRGTRPADQGPAERGGNDFGCRRREVAGLRSEIEGSQSRRVCADGARTRGSFRGQATKSRRDESRDCSGPFGGNSNAGDGDGSGESETGRGSTRERLRDQSAYSRSTGEWLTKVVAESNCDC